MQHRTLPVAVSAAALALLTACSSSPTRTDTMGNYPGSASSGAPVSSTNPALQYGNVSNIEVVPMTSRSQAGGAVLGAVIGAVVGSQVGGGSGRAAATGLGAIGGAVIGGNNARERERERARAENEIYRITVRTDAGTVAQFDYERIDDLRIGDRVRVDNGQLYRV